MWRFVLATLEGVNLGELRNAKNRRVSLARRGASTGSFTIPLSHPKADTLVSGDALVKAYCETSLGKQLRICGPVVTYEEVGEGAGNGTIAVTFGSVFWRMAFRLLGKATTGYSVGTALAPVEKCQMAADFITRVQQPVGATFDAGGDAGIRIGTITPATKGYVGPYYYKAVSEAIGELANVLDGFDYDVLPTEPTVDAQGLQLGTFVAAPFLGTTKPDVIFEYGTGKKNVANYKRQGSNEGLLNHGFNLPAGFPDNTTDVVVSASDAASIAARTRYEGVVPGDLVVPDLRQKLVQEHVAIRKQARDVFVFTPTARSGYEFGVDFDVGDVVGARVKSVVPDTNRIRFDGSVRVYGASFDIDDVGRAEPDLTLVPDGA